MFKKLIITVMLILIPTFVLADSETNEVLRNINSQLYYIQATGTVDSLALQNIYAVLDTLLQESKTLADSVTLKEMYVKIDSMLQENKIPNITIPYNYTALAADSEFAIVPGFTSIMIGINFIQYTVGDGPIQVIPKLGDDTLAVLDVPFAGVNIGAQGSILPYTEWYYFAADTIRVDVTDSLAYCRFLIVGKQ